MHPTRASDIREHYRPLERPLAAHLVGHRLRLTDHTGRVSDGVVTNLAALTAALDLGAVAIAIVSDDRIVLHACPGAGADIATTATAVLALAESMVSDGLTPVPLTDGTGGLYLIALAHGADPVAQALRYAQNLARRAPELATTDPAQSDGRTLLDPSQSAQGAGVPAPYSLLAGPDGSSAVIPLHLDEVAAISAGMPLELSASDVVGRLAEREDLAAALLEPSRPAPSAA